MVEFVHSIVYEKDFVYEKRALLHSKALFSFSQIPIAGYWLLAKVQSPCVDLDRIHDRAEDIADRRAEQGKNDNHNNRDQNKNQRIFNEALSLFLRCK